MVTPLTHQAYMCSIQVHSNWVSLVSKYFAYVENIFPFNKILGEGRLKRVKKDSFGARRYFLILPIFISSSLPLLTISPSGMIQNKSKREKLKTLPSLPPLPREVNIFTVVVVFWYVQETRHVCTYVPPPPPPCIIYHTPVAAPMNR